MRLIESSDGHGHVPPDHQCHNGGTRDVGPRRRGRVASRAINGKKERSDVSGSRL
jgi:hypothetical protein